MGELQGKVLNGVHLRVFLGPENRFGARYFLIFLGEEGGNLKDLPKVSGLYSQGEYPAYNWIEIARLNLELTAGSVARELFQRLAALIPPGGHIMVEYESTQQAETRRALRAGVPPAATPLGSLLFESGFISFKDWDIAEGGREGPRKLQGNKPLTPDHLRTKAIELVEELLTFIGEASQQSGEEVGAALGRASSLLEKLVAMVPEKAEEIRKRLKA